MRQDVEDSGVCEKLVKLWSDPGGILVGWEQDFTVDVSNASQVVELQDSMQAALNDLRFNLDQQHSYTCNFIGCVFKKVPRLPRPFEVLLFLLPANVSCFRCLLPPPFGIVQWHSPPPSRFVSLVGEDQR